MKLEIKGFKEVLLRWLLPTEAGCIIVILNKRCGNRITYEMQNKLEKFMEQFKKECEESNKQTCWEV